MFLTKSVSRFGSLLAALLLLSGLAPLSAASASSSVWSGDSLYGCVGHSIADFNVTTDGQDGAFTVDPGNPLPSGLTIDARSGVISGSPASTFAAGTFTVLNANDNDFPSHTFNALVDSVCRPTLTDITPNHGSNAGGNTVSIVGTGFEVGVSVSINDAGTLIPVTSLNRVDSTRILAVMPAYAGLGTVPLVIRNSDGSRLVTSYTYEEPTYAQILNPSTLQPVTAIQTIHYQHHSADGLGETYLVGLYGFGAGANPNYAIFANLPLGTPGVNTINGNSWSCPAPDHTAVKISNTTPSYAPTNTPGVIYRELQIDTVSNGYGSPCVAVGTYQMQMHVYDSNQKSADLSFSITEAPGGPIAFTQPTVNDIPSFGDLIVGAPIAQDPADPSSGVGISTLGDTASYALTAGTPLIPDLAVISGTTVGGQSLNSNRHAGGGGGGGCCSQPHVTGTPISSGPYSFSITATVTNGTPGTLTQVFSGFVRYATVQTVTFDGNGATSGSMDVQTSDIRSILNINGFARAGYTFNGWSTSSNGGGTLLSDNSMYEFGTDVTLYARWLAIPPATHTVTFNGNGATAGTMATQTSAGATTLTPNSFTRPGYRFDEWNTASNGSGTSYDDATTYSFNQSVTLYAMWELPPPSGGGNVSVSHTITYDGNGATSGITASQTSDGPQAVRQNGFVRPGYVFHDWNSTPNHTGFELDAGELYNFSQDVTLYAEWEKIPPAAVTISVEQPLTIQLLAGESKTILVNIADVNGVLVPASLDIPSGIIGVDGSIRITPRVDTTSLTSGVFSLQVEVLDVFGAVVPQLLASMTLHFATGVGSNIIAKSQDGLIWTPVPLLAGTSLPAGQSDGYYLDGDGHVVILTNHLTQFGIKTPQPQTLLETPTNQMVVGSGAGLVASGGAGAGAIAFTPLTPEVCSVSASGQVTALSAGICQVSSTKYGDATYMHSISKLISIKVSAKAILVQKLLVSTSKVILHLGKQFAGKTVGVESSAKSNGFYRVIGQVKLNSDGAATFNRKIYAGTTVRIRYRDKTVVSQRLASRS